jgi:hypothetical protein
LAIFRFGPRLRGLRIMPVERIVRPVGHGNFGLREPTSAWMEVQR